MRRIQGSSQAPQGWLSSVSAAPDLGALGIFLEAFLRDTHECCQHLALQKNRENSLGAHAASPAHATPRDGSDSHQSLLERPRATTGTLLSFP